MIVKGLWVVALFYIICGGTIGVIGVIITGLAMNERAELFFATWFCTSVILAIIIGKVRDRIAKRSDQV
jgi:hypothetical protein